MWSTIVGLSGYSEERVWNSFFLQYLWEFCLGMKLAEIYIKRPSAMGIPKWKYLFPICMISLIMTGIMGWAGFPWRLYNDIPSLFGYVSLALIIYKIEIIPINRFFSYTNKFSYEWYLVHILVFQIIKYFSGSQLLMSVEIILCLLISYIIAICYAKIFKKRIINQVIQNFIKNQLIV